MYLVLQQKCSADLLWMFHQEKRMPSRPFQQERNWSFIFTLFQSRRPQTLTLECAFRYTSIYLFFVAWRFLKMRRKAILRQNKKSGLEKKLHSNYNMVHEQIKKENKEREKKRREQTNLK